jgi:hypothetical protein
MTDPWENKNKTIKKPNIAIAIPYAGKWDPEWVIRTYVPLFHTGVVWCDKIPFLCKVQSLAVARNMLVNDALRAGCSHIFFVDSDNVFEAPTDANLALNMLYQCMQNNKDAKIVSGLYRAKQKVGFNYAMWKTVSKEDNKHFIPIEFWTGNWIEVDTVGMGCCLIDLEIFKNIPKPWFHWEEQDEMSEDFYFFMKAKEYGYNTKVFTDVKLSHLGGLKIKCDGNIVVSDM